MLIKYLSEMCQFCKYFRYLLTSRRPVQSCSRHPSRRYLVALLVARCARRRGHRNRSWGVGSRARMTATCGENDCVIAGFPTCSEMGDTGKTDFCVSLYERNRTFVRHKVRSRRRGPLRRRRVQYWSCGPSDVQLQGRLSFLSSTQMLKKPRCRITVDISCHCSITFVFG